MFRSSYHLMQSSPLKTSIYKQIVDKIKVAKNGIDLLIGPQGIGKSITLRELAKSESYIYFDLSLTSDNSPSSVAAKVVARDLLQVDNDDSDKKVAILYDNIDEIYRKDTIFGRSFLEELYKFSRRRPNCYSLLSSNESAMKWMLSNKHRSHVELMSEFKLQGRSIPKVNTIYLNPELGINDTLLLVNLHLPGLPQEISYYLAQILYFWNGISLNKTYDVLNELKTSNHGINKVLAYYITQWSKSYDITPNPILYQLFAANYANLNWLYYKFELIMPELIDVDYRNDPSTFKEVGRCFGTIIPKPTRNDLNRITLNKSYFSPNHKQIYPKSMGWLYTAFLHYQHNIHTSKIPSTLLSWNLANYVVRDELLYR